MSKLFTAKGNTCGFDKAGHAIIGWRGKDKFWHVAQTGEQMAEYLTNGTHKLFASNEAASLYAAEELIDTRKTEELAWWR